MKFKFPEGYIEKSKTKLVKLILTYFIKSNAFKISFEHVISIKNCEIFYILLHTKSWKSDVYLVIP